MENTIAHIELPVRDLEQAKKFYESIFTWKVTLMEEMPGLAFFKTGETSVGGAFTKSEKIAKGEIMLYIQVEDIKATLAKIVTSGGKITKEKTEIGNSYGFYAEFEDIFGNVLGVWANK